MPLLAAKHTRLPTALSAALLLFVSPASAEQGAPPVAPPPAQADPTQDLDPSKESKVDYIDSNAIKTHYQKLTQPIDRQIFKEIVQVTRDEQKAVKERTSRVLRLKSELDNLQNLCAHNQISCRTQVVAKRKELGAAMQEQVKAQKALRKQVKGIQEYVESSLAVKTEHLGVSQERAKAGPVAEAEERIFQKEIERDTEALLDIYAGVQEEIDRNERIGTKGEPVLQQRERAARDMLASKVTPAPAAPKGGGASAPPSTISGGQNGPSSPPATGGSSGASLPAGALAGLSPSQGSSASSKLPSGTRGSPSPYGNGPIAKIGTSASATTGPGSVALGGGEGGDSTAKAGTSLPSTNKSATEQRAELAKKAATPSELSANSGGRKPASSSGTGSSKVPTASSGKATPGRGSAGNAAGGALASDKAAAEEQAKEGTKDEAANPETMAAFEARLGSKEDFLLLSGPETDQAVQGMVASLANGLHPMSDSAFNEANLAAPGFDNNLGDLQGGAEGGKIDPDVSLFTRVRQYHALCQRKGRVTSAGLHKLK